MKIKKLIIIIVTIMIIISIIALIITMNVLKNKNKIDEAYNMIEQNNIQNTENKDLVLSDGTMGIIKIEKIGFEGLIQDGTDLKTLDNYVGHFKNSSIFDGNVALAAHNNSKFWKN